MDAPGDDVPHARPRPRRDAEDPGHLLRHARLVAVQLPRPAPDLGDPLGLGELAAAGQELALGPPLVGHVPGDHHAADHRPPLVGQGHEQERPHPGAVGLAGRDQPAALAAEGVPAVGLGDGGVGRAADLRHPLAHEVAGRPAAGPQGGAGGGPDLELGVEGEQDQVGEMLGQEPEPGLAGRCSACCLSGHRRPPPLLRSRTTRNHNRRVNASTKNDSDIGFSAFVTRRPSRRPGRPRRTVPGAVGAGRRCGSRPG